MIDYSGKLVNPITRMGIRPFGFCCGESPKQRLETKVVRNGTRSEGAPCTSTKRGLSGRFALMILKLSSWGLHLDSGGRDVCSKSSVGEERTVCSCTECSRIYLCGSSLVHRGLVSSSSISINAVVPLVLGTRSVWRPWHSAKSGDSGENRHWSQILASLVRTVEKATLLRRADAALTTLAEEVSPPFFVLLMTYTENMNQANIQ